MAQNWDYAELSKSAKAAGDPEKYVDMLEQASKDAGKMEMLPWLGVAAVGASLLTAATIRVVDYFKSKKKKNEADIEKKKEEIINGTRDYDDRHLNEDDEEEVRPCPECGGCLHWDGKVWECSNCEYTEEE